MFVIHVHMGEDIQRYSFQLTTGKEEAHGEAESGYRIFLHKTFR